MIEVNLFDENFSGTMHGDFDLSHLKRTPKKIKWVKNQLKFDGTTVFTDKYMGSDLVDKVQCKMKVAWLIEPVEVHKKYYKLAQKFEDKFDYIFTHEQSLLDKNPQKYKKCTFAGTWLTDKEIEIVPNKTKLMSLIASKQKNKKGHKLRHKIAKKYADKFNIDLWGFAYKRFKYKSDPLKDYYFSIIIINSRRLNWFTEALIDCFLMKTVPIFWGAPNIGDFFNLNGIIPFTSSWSLKSILKNLTMDDYFKRKEAIEDNFKIANNYLSLDDCFANSLLNLNGCK